MTTLKRQSSPSATAFAGATSIGIRAPTAGGLPAAYPTARQVRLHLRSRRTATPVATLSVQPPHATRTGQAVPLPIQVYHGILEQTKKSGRVQVVMFHADHCRSCKAAKAKFVGMMEERTEEFNYALVNLTHDRTAAEKLGIANLPTFHFYVAKGDSVGLLDEFQCGGLGCNQRINRRLEKFSASNFDIDEYEF